MSTLARLLGGRKPEPAPTQRPLSFSAIAQMQEDARATATRAYRIEAQKRFDQIGLPYAPKHRAEGVA